MRWGMHCKVFERKRIKEYGQFAEAWLFLAMARSLIFFVPFRKLLPVLGRTVNQEEAKKMVFNQTASWDSLNAVRLSIRRASHKSPWRTKCFEQALAARMMLRRRGVWSVVFFGVNKYPSDCSKKLTAHAWLMCSGMSVTGGGDNSMYTVVGCFLV